MALKLSQEDLDQVRTWILALGSMDSEVRYYAQEQLLNWLSESPAHHTPHLLSLCDSAASERQKRLLGAIIGEVASLDILPTLASFGVRATYNGTIACRAVGYWGKRAPVSDVVLGICMCLDVSFSTASKPLLDYTLELATERNAQEPDAAFWPVIRKLSSREARKHPRAIQTGKYLAGLLPPTDLPCPSGGFQASPMNLPTPAQSNLDNAHGLPMPGAADESESRGSWWRRWKP